MTRRLFTAALTIVGTVAHEIGSLLVELGEALGVDKVVTDPHVTVDVTRIPDAALTAQVEQWRRFLSGPL